MIAPNVSCMKQIGNISDVVDESKHEQNFASPCIFRTRQALPQVTPTHTLPVPRAESVEKEQ